MCTTTPRHQLRDFSKSAMPEQISQISLARQHSYLWADSRPQGKELATLESTQAGGRSGKKEGIKRCLIGFKWAIRISSWMRGEKKTSSL